MNEIMKMVKKDFLYLTSSAKSSLFVAFIICFFMPFGSLATCIVVPALMGYVLVYTSMAYEERSKVELLNASLPITRKELCSAKYIESILYVVGGCILSLIGTTLHLFSQLHLEARQVVEILPGLMIMALIVGGIYIGIILPVVFLLGTVKARYYLMFSYIIVFMLANMSGGIQMSQGLLKVLNQRGSVLLSLGIVLAIGILYVSYVISVKLWRKKDFK